MRTWIAFTIVIAASACGPDTQSTAGAGGSSGTAPLGGSGSGTSGAAGTATSGGGAVSASGASSFAGNAGASAGSPASGGTAVGGTSAGGASTGGTSAGGVANAGRAGASGSAGTAGSGGSGGAPVVVLPPGVSNLFPRPGAQGMCPDPPLRLTFAGVPSVGTAGSLRVFDAAAPTTAVATVNFATMTVQDTIGGQVFNMARRVHVDGNDVVVYLPSRALGYNKTYFVNVDSGAIRGPGNAAFSISGSSAWSFRTAAAAPVSPNALHVALDGSGQFCSPQGALDLVPANNRTRITIELSPGTYRGNVLFSGKQNVTLRGLDRRSVVISGVNNDVLNPGSRGRALVGADNANGLILENLRIHNQTPQGGSQAEALRLQSCVECVVRDADILSLQDTLLWSGRIYARNCYIEGNVDFVWGDGIAYFDSCEIKTVGRSGPIVQARNAVGANGYIFVDSRITSDAGLTGGVLARIDVTGYPGSHVAYVNCVLGAHIAAVGWTITGGAPPATLRFWEYQSRNEAGALINTGGRATGATQITPQQATALRDKAAVLGGWLPPP